MMMRMGSLGLWLFALLFAAGARASTSISPSHPDLQYIGRWQDSNPAQPWAQAQGSSFIASFTGTSIAAILNVAGASTFV